MCVVDLRVYIKEKSFWWQKLKLVFYLIFTRASSNYPVYFNPSILKYYVLVHDSYSNVDDAAAQVIVDDAQGLKLA